MDTLRMLYDRRDSNKVKHAAKLLINMVAMADYL